MSDHRSLVARLLRCVAVISVLRTGAVAQHAVGYRRHCSIAEIRIQEFGTARIRA
jgi:hypothetical protein